jgi:hypothetical protein
MMGPKRAEKLREMGISNFKQLMERAVSMSEDAFKAEFGGRSGALDNVAGPFHEVLLAWHYSQSEKRGQKIPQTDAWLMFADNHGVPAESLASRSGWPDGMLGEIRVQKLAAQGVTKTSELMNFALTMDQSEFVQTFGGRSGSLDNRAAAFYSFLLRSANHNGIKAPQTKPNPIPTDHRPNTSSSPNRMLIAIVLLVLAVAYKFVA